MASRSVLLLLAVCFATSGQETPRIVEWERGVALQTSDPSMAMFLWFYEWNMFDAMIPGEHTPGSRQNERRIDSRGASAEILAPALHLRVKAVPGGADLTLRVTNITDREWPAIAGIIPCWNPGRVEGTNPSSPLPLNRNFADLGRRLTFFMSASGLSPLASREIHFNHMLRPLVEREAVDRQFAFSHKWPTSTVDATAGYIVRTSEDGNWVTGIGWDDYLSVQGHNPWSCMHACARVGPLVPGQSKTIRGKLVLFRGSVDECVRRFRKERANRNDHGDSSPVDLIAWTVLTWASALVDAGVELSNKGLFQEAGDSHAVANRSLPPQGVDRRRRAQSRNDR